MTGVGNREPVFVQSYQLASTASCTFGRVGSLLLSAQYFPISRASGESHLFPLSRREQATVGTTAWTSFEAWAVICCAPYWCNLQKMRRQAQRAVYCRRRGSRAAVSCWIDQALSH